MQRPSLRLLWRPSWQPSCMERSRETWELETNDPSLPSPSMWGDCRKRLGKPAAWLPRVLLMRVTGFEGQCYQQNKEGCLI